MRRLLPVPAPLPRRWWVAAPVLLATSLGLMAPNVVPGSFPGNPDLPFAAVTTNLHWQLHARGLAGVMADDLHGFPLRTDRVVTDGFPLDAFASWPLTAILGHDLGMWAWIIGTFWAAGLAAAWLGMRWWGTLGAGLVAGIGFQAGEALLREVAEGRPTQAFAAVFLPLALGFGVEVARSGRARPAAGAGLAAALGTLASWGMAPVLVLAALGPGIGAFAGSFFSGRGAEPPATPPALSPGSTGRGFAPPPRPTLTPLLLTLGALVAPLAPVVAWVIAGRGELPSFGMDPWQEAVLGLRQVRPVDLAAARIHGLGGVAVGTLARPALLLAAAWVAWRGRVRHWGLPLAFACLAGLLGLGSWLPGPVVLPWGWLQELPGLGRLWWPDRAWIAVSLGLALLAAGAPRRWAPALAALVFLEAWLASSALPLQRLPPGPSPAAEVLARAPDVPLVLLPTGEGPFRPDRLDLVDQVHHGRPLANGTRPVLDLTSPDAVLRGWRNNAGLRALLACEMGGGAGSTDAERAAAGDQLVRAGLREVYLDPRYVASDPSYAACVEGVLAGWERNEEPPLVRFRAR